jgi:hypothetical protein
MFWKKKKAPEKKVNIILGMVLLNSDQPFSFDIFKKDYLENNEVAIPSHEGSDSAYVFEFEGEMVALSFMPAPVPQGDIDATAHYAYNWPTVLEDLKSHRSHIIVSILTGGDNQLKRYVMFTTMVCSLLRTNDAPGVYMGNQSLLISKEEYLESAAGWSEDFLPINLWVYFGLRSYENKNSGYTYGLTEWGKTEMEIVESNKPIEDIREFLFNLSHYVIQSDVTFHDGETCGVSEEQKIKITLSKARFVEGKSIKLNF